MTYSEIVIAEIQKGNLEVAEENIELAINYDDEETLFLLGNTLYQLGFLIETRKVYNYLLEKNPADDELKIYLAEIDIEDGNELEALDLLHSIEETSPIYPQSLLVQADYYQLNGLPEVSIQKLTEAENLLPDEPIVLFALAEIYYTTADYQQAIHYYEKVTLQGHDEIAGIILSERLGNAYMLIGEYFEAIDYFNEALTFRETPEIYYQLGLVYVQQTEWTKAIEPLEKAKTLDPSLSGAYFVLSEVYEQQNNYEKALEEIKEGISQNELNLDFYFKAAELSVKLNDEENARKYYEEAISIAPDSERAHLKYAEYLNYMGSFEETIHLLNSADETTKQLPEALWLLGTAYNNIEDYGKARDYFAEASQYLSEDLDFLKEYAFFLREDGQPEKMREIANKYVMLNSESDFEIMALLDEDYF